MGQPLGSARRGPGSDGAFARASVFFQPFTRLIRQSKACVRRSPPWHGVCDECAATLPRLAAVGALRTAEGKLVRSTIVSSRTRRAHTPRLAHTMTSALEPERDFPASLAPRALPRRCPALEFTAVPAKNQ